MLLHYFQLIFIIVSHNLFYYMLQSFDKLLQLHADILVSPHYFYENQVIVILLDLFTGHPIQFW